MAKQKKRNAKDLFDLARSLIEDHAERDALYDRLDDLYDQVRKQQDDGEDEERVQHVVMPYATNTIDLVADLAADLELTLEVPAAADTKTAQAEADLAEEWLLALIHANETKQRRNLVRDGSWFGGQRAMVVYRTLFLSELVEEDGETFKVNGMPVLIQIRDPRYVYVSWGPLGPDFVVEAWLRPAADIKRQYPGVLEDDVDGQSQVEWVEYWDDTYRVYWANGTPVKFKEPGSRGKTDMVRHGYGCLPYSIAMARSTPRENPDKKARPLLAAPETLAHNIDTWFSILATAGHSNATAAFLHYTSNFGRDGTPAIDMTPGAVTPLPVGDKVEPLQRANLPTDFFQLGQMLLQAWQQSTVPFTMFGEGAGNMAGYAINLTSQSGRRPLVPVYAAVQDALAGACRNAAIICRDKVAPLIGKDKIPLVVMGKATRADGRERAVRRSLELDTTKVGDDFEVTCTIGDPMPADEASNVRLALETTQGDKPLLSQFTALQKFKIVGNPTEEMDRITAEKLWAQLADKEGLKLLVKYGYLPEGADQQQQQPGGLGMPPGAPPPAGMPSPGGQPQLPPEVIAQMMAMLQGGGQPGQPQMDPAMLQQLSGQPPAPTLDQMAGVPPVMPQLPGGM